MMGWRCPVDFSGERYPSCGIRLTSGASFARHAQREAA